MKLMTEIDDKYYVVSMEELKKYEVSADKFDAEAVDDAVVALTIPANSIGQPEVEGQYDRPSYSQGNFGGSPNRPATPVRDFINRQKDNFRQKYGGSSSGTSTSGGNRD